MPEPEKMAVQGLAEAWLRSVCLEIAKLLTEELANSDLEYISPVR